jgi:transposase
MNLPESKIIELKARHKKERDKRICDRIKAVLLINTGYTYQEVANILLLDDDTVRRHIEEYLALEKLDNNHKGSESKLNMQQTDELIAYLQEHTFMNVKPIVDYVKTTYGITYTNSGMTTWLKLHKFAYKKPHAVPSKFNQQAQDEFIQVLHTLKEEGNPLYFLDATHPEHQSKLDYGWIYKGSNKAIQTTAIQKRVHIFGALSYATNELTIVEDTTINSQSVIAILEKLKFSHRPGTIINCVLDNAKYQKSFIVQEYITNNPNIKLHYLPAYSPNLNLIERLWKFMHKHVTNNCYYEYFENFRYSILSFLRNIADFKDDLKTLITFKFQKLNYDIANFVK